MQFSAFYSPDPAHADLKCKMHNCNVFLHRFINTVNSHSTIILNSKTGPKRCPRFRSNATIGLSCWPDLTITALAALMETAA
jgi:hypothetical protein